MSCTPLLKSGETGLTYYKLTDSIALLSGIRQISHFRIARKNR